MRIMVLGGGGREHAVIHALSKSKITTELHCCPGNPGIAKLAKCHIGDPCNPAEMLTLCKSNGIELVFVGPEAPLVAGTADILREAGILVMGPSMLGARLEGSKAYSKQFMAKYKIPTSSFDLCTDIDSCRKALKKRSAPYVVKADGLASGKGAFLLDTFEEAMNTCAMMLEDFLLGVAGRVVIIEDFVPGQEATVLALTDGKTIRVLPSSQDHKRILDGDKGDNTGGMGAYSPVPWVDDKFMKKVTQEILQPTLDGLEIEAIPFCGVIYAGIMVSPDGSLSLLEYNVRLGDPEAQVVLPVFDGDFGEVILACTQGKLNEIDWPTPKLNALGVVMSSGGYPNQFEKGFEIIESFNSIPSTYVYHAGTKLDSEGKLVTAGGRVLTVVGIAETLQKARDLAYKRVESISFKNAFYRKDIGDKSLKGVIK
ncbi:MAG: phosphoribosylamine--glycine ligase [Synergistaceae bacterium]|nr:phosphoribosylamine--glycine ligase [Synergistaceae bacterium]